MHPLDGIRVADMTSMINGPLAAMLLSDMGAEVIKIEPPDGDTWRSVAGGFVAYNRGKRSIALDLKKPEAKQIITRIIERSDILVENARWGVWHRLGLDYESVKKIKPDIIYLSVLGHGSKGPYSQLPGYDPLLQARSGQMAGQGGIGKPPVFHMIALNDVGCPMLGAYGVVLALLMRARTGKGQHVEMSLTNASIALQSGEFVDYAGMRRKYSGDIRLKGLRATHRHYQTGDGRWIFIMCPEEGHWQDLCHVMGLEKLLTDPGFESPGARKENDEALVEILVKTFQTRSSSEWLAALAEADVPASLGKDAIEILTDPHCLANNLYDDREHPELGPVRQIGIAPRFSDMSGLIRRTAPMLGQHTDEVLVEMGYTAEEIEDFKTARVVFTPKA